MILTDVEIRQAVTQKEIRIDPFEEDQLQPASYDLRVGRQAATVSSKGLINVADQGYILLEPGDFALITTHEKLELSQMYVGRFGLRSKYARRGLILTCGPQIDPGWRGRLIFGIANLTADPTPIKHLDGIVSVEFHRLQKPVGKPYSGPYQDREQLGAEDISFIVAPKGMALSEVLSTLGALNQAARATDAEVKALIGDVNLLKYGIPIIVTLGIAIIGIIVGLR